MSEEPEEDEDKKDGTKMGTRSGFPLTDIFKPHPVIEILESFIKPFILIGQHLPLLPPPNLYGSYGYKEQYPPDGIDKILKYIENNPKPGKRVKYY